MVATLLGGIIGSERMHRGKDAGIRTHALVALAALHHLHQVPEFQRAGYRCITFDNRGIGATENEDEFGIEEMVADTAELIEKLDAGPARIVGVSMGSYIAQELMLARPELVSASVLMATRGRHDRARSFFRDAERELYDSGIELPA